MRRNDWGGIPSDRVVAVVAALDTGRVQIGSGYLVTDQLVLTARHCTLDKKTGSLATLLQVASRSGGPEAPATLSAVASELDVVMLSVKDPPWPVPVASEPPRFGRVDRSRSTELNDCQAIGFPLWQMDPSDQGRNAAELHGTIRVTEDAEAGLLVMRDPELRDVAIPETIAAQDREDRSPWGGLSGALVFYQGLALGVIIEHRPWKGGSAMTILPVERLATASMGGNANLAAVLGLPPAAKLPLAVPQSGGIPGEQIRRRWPLPNFNLPGPLEQQWFVGRDRELAECRDKLIDNGFLVIHGLDGQGKTTLAKMYATQFQDHYDLMWLVPASQEAGVSTRLELLASKLEVVTASEPQAGELRYALRKELEPSDRWLLIFDDVRDWKSIQDYIPPVPPLRGHIIATTQDIRGVQDIPDLMPGYLPLGRLPSAASTKYLMKRIGSASEADAKRLAHDLGYMASALEFAGKEYGPTGIPDTRDTPASDAVHKLHVLWEDSLHRLQEQAKKQPEFSLAYSLLEFCSLFASDQIPETILTLPPGDNKPVDELRGALTDPSKYSNLVRILRERSLLEAPRGSHAIIVHTLLRAYLRGKMKMSSDRLRGRLSVAIGLLQDAFYEPWFAANALRCAFALPHAEACLEIAEQDEIASGEAAILMIRMAHYHRTRGEIFKASDLHERALKLREKAFGDNSREVARSLINLGIVLKEMGKPDEGIKRYQRSLRILTSAEPPDEENAALCRENLGLALIAKGQYSKAVDLHNQAYNFWIKQNPRHSNVAIILGNMGLALYLLGDLSQAEKVLQRAVDIGQEALEMGFSKLDLAEMIHNQGQVLRARAGVYDAWRARPKLEKALGLRSEELGDQHLSVIETRTALSRVFRCEGEYAKADEELKSASYALEEIRKSDILGFGPPGSPDLSSKYECSLLIAEGELRFALGNYTGAKQSLQRAQELAVRLAREEVSLPP